ncbi:sensor histidine kinase [Salisaeta longa]|uniref:sensor histidine kinase n=1 Tax=Salisaeta longa TaxID=503170 RepID=UPI0003B6A157|nr:histidine kinase [Salisaeta longa]
MTRKQAYWVCQLGGWGLWAAFGVVLYALLEDAAHTIELGTGFVLTVGLGVGLTHAYRAYLRAYNWTRLPLRALIPRMLLAAVLLSVIWNLVQIGMSEAGWLPEGAGDLSTLQKPVLLVSALTGGGLLLLVWSTIYFGLHFFWNYRQAEIDRLEMAVQSREAKLDALKLQLNPHFLFNSLNSVRALVAEDPEQAQTMITRLARLLRTTLQSSKTVTVPLRKEIEIVRTYLELESVRLEERLAYRIDVPPAVCSRSVPPLLVQTLVENAIKHGIAPRPNGGTVRVSAHCAADALHLRVANTGQLNGSDRSGGIGLQNVRERLRLLFGSEASIELGMDGPATVVATARVPRNPSRVQTGTDASATKPADATHAAATSSQRS